MGAIRTRGFTVATEDTNWCLFFMNEFYPPSGRGEDTCYERGIVMDRGLFQLKGVTLDSREPGNDKTGRALHNVNRRTEFMAFRQVKLMSWQPLDCSESWRI